MVRRIACCLTSGVMLWTALAAAGADDPGRLVETIIEKMEVPRGIALDVGAGDGTMALELARRTKLQVRCIEPDEAAAQKIRQAADAAGMYGRLTVDAAALSPLPYPTHCASVVICGDQFASGLRGRDAAEILRCLRPGGVAYIGQGAAAGKAGRPLTADALRQWLTAAGVRSFEITERDGVWAVVRKTRGEGWDEWTHRAHDAANTFGSDDRVSGLRFRPVWVDRCLPALASAGVLLAGGVQVELGMEYPPAPKKYPPSAAKTTPYIHVADAYTGIELWTRMGKAELPLDRSVYDYAAERSCSDIAVAGGRLYVLGGRQCHVFGLLDGRTLGRFDVPAEAKADASDIWLHASVVGDVLFGAVGPSPKYRVSWANTTWRGVAGALFAMDRTSGRLLWLHGGPVRVSSIAVADGQVCFFDEGQALHALDAATGRRQWSNRDTHVPAKARFSTCSIYAGKIWALYNPTGNTGSDAMMKGRTLAAYSADDGRLLFEPKFTEGPVSTLTFSGGQVFAAPQHSGDRIYVLDAATGEPVNTLLERRQRSGITGCTPPVATPSLLLLRGRRGPTVADRRTDQRTWFSSMRPTCQYPAIPANGMLYVQAPGCNCPQPLRVNFAVVPDPRPAAEKMPADDPARLVRGPAFGEKVNEDLGPDPWVSWRADAARSGRTDAAPPEAMTQQWSIQPGGELTPVAAAGGLVYVGTSAGRVLAVDAAAGAARWAFLAAGPIRIAPFLWAGRVYFADDEGWAYCVRAGDGRLIWRFRAALAEDRLVGYGRLMSRWPVATGVLAADGTAYFAAGLFADDGGTFYAVDARSGEARWSRPMTAAKGAMALGRDVVFVPTVGGSPCGFRLGGEKPQPVSNKIWHSSAYGARGTWVAAVGADALVGSPDLIFTHHVVGYMDRQRLLPVVTDEAIFLRQGRVLTADRRTAYRLDVDKAMFVTTGTPAEYGSTTSADPADRLWSAWPDVPVTAIILAGGTLLTGGDGVVCATRAADGKALCRAPVDGAVADLAVQGGRLFVATDAGRLVCLGAKP